MVRHCPTCNRTSDEAHFYGDFCEFCALEKIGNKLPTEVKVTVCKRCGRINVAGDFTEKDDAAIEQVLRSHFKAFDLKLISQIDSAAIVSLSRYEDNIEGLRREVALKYVKVMCPRCNRQSAGYYEAVIQLRGNNQRVSRMMHKIEEVFFGAGEFIARVERANNGCDIYVSSKKLASAFMSERKLKPVMSYQLAGLKRGKKLYRNTYALHLD
ncbi:MAG: hypothetical protein KGH49_01495 [Candidatus Micrarchaeota archaeon]|nr:hypothetical protein [Candidatus Micrarchaeota archaeon]